jgi:hypothetical protein
MNAKSCCKDDLVLLEAARAVLAVFRTPLDQQRLPPSPTAALRLLETALKPYDRPQD